MAEKTQIVEQEQRVLRTYAKAWDFETVIYTVGDIALPFPINLTQLGFFGASLFLCFIIFAILPSFNIIPGVIKYLVLPFLLMKAATRLKVDGKKPYLWLLGEFKYLFLETKTLSRFKKYREEPEFKFKTQGLFWRVK